MQTPRRMLAAVTIVLLALCAPPRRGAEAAPHRARAAKQATSKHTTSKHATAEPETKRQRASEPKAEPKPEPAPTRPAVQGGAVSQAPDSEEPPVRHRAK